MQFQSKKEKKKSLRVMYQSSRLVSCHYSNIMVEEQFPLMHFNISFGVNVKQSNMHKKTSFIILFY